MLLGDYFLKDLIRDALGFQSRREILPEPDWFIWIKIGLTIGGFVFLLFSFGITMGLFQWFLAERSYKKTLHFEQDN